MYRAAADQFIVELTRCIGTSRWSVDFRGAFQFCIPTFHVIPPIRWIACTIRSPNAPHVSVVSCSNFRTHSVLRARYMLRLEVSP